jgi:hypothetical protein
MTESVQQEPKKERVPAELIALFRILLKEPSPDHSFETCEICKANGITRLDSSREISYGNTSSL